MSGITLALIATVFFVLQTGFQKRLADRANVFIIIWGSWTLAAIGFGIATFIEGWPIFTSSFWPVFIINVVLLIISNFLIIRAVQISPLSLTIPYLAFTPVFTLLTSWLILGEFPSRWGLIGILLIPIGALLLHRPNNTYNIKSILSAIKNERGAVYTIIVAAI